MTLEMMSRTGDPIDPGGCWPKMGRWPRGGGAAVGWMDRLGSSRCSLLGFWASRDETTGCVVVC